MTFPDQIWEGIKSGDVNSLSQLYQLYHQDLFNFGKKMTRDEQLIEDAIQESFIAIWKYRNTLSKPMFVKSYVLKIFRNQLLSIFKERSAITYTDKSLNFNFEISFDQRIIEGEDADALSEHINKAIRQLTNRQKEIIYYRFYEDLSFEEIAEIMVMQTRATYKLTARALAALKEIMNPESFNLLLILLNAVSFLTLHADSEAVLR